MKGETRMQNRKSWIAAAVAAGLVCMAEGGDLMDSGGSEGGCDAFMKLASSDEGRLLAYAEAVGTFREQAAKDPENAVRAFFDAKLAVNWTTRITSEILYPVQADFFQGGIMLSGPQDGSFGIVAIYNPWWDAILLLKGRLPREVCEGAAPFQVGEFHLMSGETFRGEPVESDEKSIRRLTVIPEKDPLSLELWRVSSGTKAAFERFFGEARSVSWGKLASVLMSIDAKREMCRISLRAGLRLKLKLALLKNAEAAGIGAHVVKMARDGTLFQLYSYFKEPNSRKLLSDFVDMPALFRKEFSLYGYVPTSEGALYLLVCRKMPRLYVTATVPVDVPKRPASFEWFDLAKSEEMLKALAEGGKEASK